MPRLPYSLNSYTGGATPGFIAGSGIGAADTTITITGTGSTWTTLGSGNGFNLSLQYGQTTEEKIYVPVISGAFAGTNTPYATISGFSSGANVIADTYITPSGDKIFLPQQISGNIGVFSTATNTLTTILSGNNTSLLGLQGAAFSTNNQTYFGGYASGFVLVYNTTTNAYITTLSGATYGLNGNSQYITTTTTSSGNFLYVAGPVNNAVSVINTATNTLATVWSGTSFNFSNIGNMSAINGKMYVSNQAANKITVVNLNTNTYVTTISGLTTGFNTPLSSVTTTVSGVPYVYVWNYNGNSVSVINSNTDTVTAIISGGTLNTGNNGTQTIMSMQTTTSGNYLFVTSLGGNSISVFDTATNNLIYTISGTQYNLNAPGGLAITPSGNFAYIANTNTAGNLNVVSLYTISPYLTGSGSITVSGVTRGIDNTTAQVHPSGSSVTPVLTAVELREANALVNQAIFPAATYSGQALASTGSGIVYTPQFTPGTKLNNAILKSPLETINILNTGINGGLTINTSSGNTSFYTVPASGNFTVNITTNNTLATVMNSGQSITTNLLATQGSTGYALLQSGNYSGISVDGYTITSGQNYYFNTISGIAPISSGVANSIDIYTFTVLRNNLNFDTVLSGYNPDVWFKLNDPNSTRVATDSSVNGYIGNYSGNVIQVQQGFNPVIPSDYSAYFNPAGQNIVSTNYTPNWGNNQSFTINAWFNTTQSTRGDFVVIGSNASAINNGIFMFTNATGNLEVDNAFVGGPVSSTKVNDGTWHMATLQATAVSAGNTTYQLYVDGVANGTSTSMAPNMVASGSLVIGASTNGGFQYTGYVNQVAIFRSALSAAQIQNLYQAGRPYTVLSSKVAASGVLYSTGLYNFPVGTSLSFTSAGVSGQNGPSLAQAITGLSSNQSTSWSSNTQFFNQGSYNGYQLWTVPATGTYRITASGAAGGNCTSYGYYGGSGAVMQGDFSLTQGQQLTILVGQTAPSNIGFSQGGQQAGSGGGTFVALGATASTATALIVAGGGGGAWIFTGNPSYNYGRGGTTYTFGSNGGQGNGGVGATGPNGVGGNGQQGNAAGYTGNGTNSSGAAATSFTNGGIGSQENLSWGTYNCYGGFGGGGGGGLAVGGGGGYGGGGYGTWASWGGGGGGGSYNSGANQVNTNGTDNNSALTGNARNGSVTIVRLS